MTRKMMGALAVLALGLLLTGGVAMAKFVACTGGQCLGTQFSDTISGLNSTSVPDRIFAIGSNDHVETNAGDDFANGGAGHDALHGQAGKDTLQGSSGNDFITGGPGRDTIKGGSGNDGIVSAESVAFGRPEADVVDCGENLNGPDDDRADVDRLDTVTNCERVFVIE
jgi:Ca2+-binding RTX toxin-like protein